MYKSRKLRKFVFTLFIVALVWSCEMPAPPSNEPKEVFPTILFDNSQPSMSYQIDTFFENRYQIGRFNGVVLFAKDGKIVHHKAYGFSNFKNKDSLHINNAFQLASVSKPITAIGLLKLVASQQIGLDDDLLQFFPNLPYADIKIRDLLAHRSGLPNYMYFVDEVWQNKDSSITNAEMINIMERDTPKVYYAPNVKYHYCNTNYALLASVIEKVSGQTYEQYMQDSIFRPLGMDSTFIYNRNVQRQIPQAVIGHNAYLTPKDNIYLNGVVGDKGIYASVLDLYKLDRALYDENFISQELLEVAFSPFSTNLTKRHKDNYGLGWRIQQPSEHGKVVYHGGWWKGFKTYFIRMIDKNQTIIVLTNTTKGGYLDKMAMQNLFEVENDEKLVE